MAKERVIRRAILRDEQEPHPLINAIRDVCARMDLVENRFSMENDADLVEGCIYELESLRAQYRYLLRLAREQGVSSRERTHLWNE